MIKRTLYFLSLFLCTVLAFGQHEQAIDSSFGSNGFLKVEGSDFFINNDRIVVAELDSHRVHFHAYDLDGEPLINWGFNGIKTVELNPEFVIRQARISSNSGYLLQGHTLSYIPFTVRLQNEEMLDSSFANNGVLVFNSYDIFSNHTTMDNGKTIIVKPEDSSRYSHIIQLDEQGVIDSAFGEEGVIEFTDKGGGFINPVILSDDLMVIKEYHPITNITNATGHTLYFFNSKEVFGGASFFPFQHGGISSTPDSSAIFGFCQYPGDNITAKLGKISKNGDRLAFDTLSEAHHFTTEPANSYTLISDIDVSDEGDIMVFGASFKQGPENLIMFLKGMDHSGILIPAFGESGNIFFKKPGLDRAYYYPGRIQSLNGSGVLLSARIDDLVSGPQNYLMKLSSDFLSTAVLQIDQRFSVYPNPGRQIFNISGKDKMIITNITDLSGRHVPFIENDEGFELINTISGQLFLHYRVNDRPHVHRFISQ